MATVKTTLTKQSTDPWILLTDATLFTQEEMDNVVTPYTNFVKSLTGNQGLTTDINGDTAVFTWTYDTMENAATARQEMTDITNTIVSAKNFLLHSKLQSANAIYKSSTIYE